MKAHDVSEERTAKALPRLQVARAAVSAMDRISLEQGLLASTVMDETTYRRLFTQFLNEYWGAFHEVLEAQSVTPRILADPLFEALVMAHQRFAASRELDPAVERLGRVWKHVAERRIVTVEAPLSAREIQHARTQFGTIFDMLLSAGVLNHEACLRGGPMGD